MTSQKLQKENMGVTWTGIAYLRMADTFNISAENRIKLIDLMNEPDCEKSDWFEKMVPWEDSVRKLFDVFQTDRNTFYCVLSGILDDNKKIKKMMSEN